MNCLFACSFSYAIVVIIVDCFLIRISSFYENIFFLF